MASLSSLDTLDFEMRSFPAVEINAGHNIHHESAKLLQNFIS